MIEEPPAHEPLLAALGGEPLALKLYLGEELDRWQENHMVPLFVFAGQLLVGETDMILLDAKLALTKTQDAWNLYAANQPGEAVQAFGAAGAIRTQNLYPILQEVLVERGISFKVAPFSSCAQLAYLDKLDLSYIDGLMGSAELLLYDIFDSFYYPPTSADWKDKAFHGISKSEEISRLKVTPELYLDALLMVGTSFLPHFPPLDTTLIPNQPFNIQDAVNTLKTTNKSIRSACNSFDDTLKLRDPHWLDKFHKAKMMVMHPIIVDEIGEVHPNNVLKLTSDNSAYLGLHLPSELYHYMSEGLVSPRIMNPFVSLESVTYPTLDGGSSDEYKSLVTTSLKPLKETTLGLISSRVHRGFKFNKIKQRFWFDENLQGQLAHSEKQPDTDDKAKTWAVKESGSWSKDKDLLSDRYFAFAVSSLQVSYRFPPSTSRWD
jgi:hypothetical protein